MNVVQPIKKLEDIQKIKKYLAKKPRDTLLFSFGINTGLRISDILSLDVGDVKGRDYIEIREKKTNKYKKFPLNRFLKEEIDVFVECLPSEQPLFYTQKHCRLDRAQAYRILNKAAQAVGVKERIGTHTLRKTFGYHHYKKYNDIVPLQKIFNHSSPSVTLRYIGIEQDTIDFIKGISLYPFLVILSYIYCYIIISYICERLIYHSIPKISHSIWRMKSGESSVFIRGVSV